MHLEGYELAFAADVGVRRQISALLRRSRNAHGLSGDDDGWGKHIEGACGEMAVAKRTGRYWPASVDTHKKGDDVDGLQVRTRSLDWYELNIRPDDGDEKIFVLVTGRAPNFILRGWMYGLDAKKDEFWKAPNDREPIWFVPQDRLYPMSSLPETF